MLEDQPTLWRWAATIVYIGAGLVMLGILLLMISYISGASLFVFSLVLLVSAMEVLLAWVGLRAESGAPRQGTVAEEHGYGAPLLYLESR